MDIPFEKYLIRLHFEWDTWHDRDSTSLQVCPVVENYVSQNSQIFVTYMLQRCSRSPSGHFWVDAQFFQNIYYIFFVTIK